MAAGERHDALPVEPCSGATDGLVRQAKVPGDVASAHRQFYPWGLLPITELEHTQEHGNAGVRLLTRQDDLLTLRFAQFMGHFDEKLQLELTVTKEHACKGADRDFEADGRRQCLHRIDVTPILSEATHIAGKEEREHPFASGGEVLKRLDDAFFHDKYEVRR